MDQNGTNMGPNGNDMGTKMTKWDTRGHNGTQEDQIGLNGTQSIKPDEMGQKREQNGTYVRRPNRTYGYKGKMRTKWDQ